MNQEATQKKGLNISARSFLTALAVIFALMALTYVLTFLIPGGQFERNEAGEIISENNFTEVEGGIPFWKWILSPFLVLAADGSATLIAVIAFLLVIGGVFGSLNACGLMKYMLDKITYRFGQKRDVLMAVIIFFFMAMGSLIGSFEECVPLVPLVVALAIRLGWDALTGFAMSMLAVSCGFAAGVFNPFTVGVAQELADLPMFSGAWLRGLAFVLIYALLLFFIRMHSKKIEKPITEVCESACFERNEKMDKGLICFASVIGSGIFITLCSPFITALQDYTMIIVAVMFFIAGILSTLISRMSGKDLAKTFGAGTLGMLPAVLMILMASSIRYTMEESHILDSVLHTAITAAKSMPNWGIILFIYFIVLVMNFFIGSGSAKAIMLIPLIVPLAKYFGISPQLCILAFAFGDGFSNVFYPTNAALLISLGLADISYGKWFRWSWKFQLSNLVLTSLLLLFGLIIAY